MDSNKRPDTMERITTKELADKFIEEQIADVRAQVGNKKVLLAGEDDSENNYLSLRDATEKISPQNKETCYEYWFVDDKSIREIFLEKTQLNKTE